MRQLNKLKSLRIQNGIIQKEIAKILGIGLSTYIQKENGYMPFNEWEIYRILKTFNTTYEEIFVKEFERNYSYAKPSKKARNKNAKISNL
ncbi:MAG: helix-turn-helix domain-containing protein [Oscillospiraceae bacterium]|nr:helix-turn-helix domain-containing protein [Oscillospiraceae bacterium]